MHYFFKTYDITGANFIQRLDVHGEEDEDAEVSGPRVRARD